MTAPLCTRCRNEPAVQGSEFGVRCLWPEPFAARVAELAAEGDRLGDAFRARTAAMEHVPTYPQRQNPEPSHRELRYGVEQRARRPDEDEPRDWYGGWPSYREPWQADDSRRWHEDGDERYEFRVVEFVPSAAHEQCAKCGTVGPVDVPCRGCELRAAASEPMLEVHGIEEYLRTGAPPRYYEPDPRGLDDAGVRDVPDKPCCARMEGGWCVSEEGHGGECK